MDNHERRELMHHHDFVACMHSTKENIDLDKTLKYYDKSRDVKLQQLESQERELKQVLSDLKAEKEYHKRKGSVIDGSKLKEKKDHPKGKSKKGVLVKLSPGKIDTESTSPPNSHDVAVRMLFDKKKKKKKKLGWKKDADAAHKVIGMEEDVPKSQSARNTTFKLPVIETDTRRSSINDPEHIQIRTKRYREENQQEQETSTLPLKSEEEQTKTYRKTPYPRNVITNKEDEEDVTGGDILTLEVAIDEKPVSISVNMNTPPKKPHQAWNEPSAGQERVPKRKSKHSGTALALPELPKDKSSLVEIQVNDLPHSSSRRGSDFQTKIPSAEKQRKREKEGTPSRESIRKGSFSGCKTEQDRIHLQKYIKNREECARRYSLRHEDELERQRQYEYDPYGGSGGQRRHSYGGGGAQRRGSHVGADSFHRRDSLDSHGSTHGSRRDSLGSHGSMHGRRESHGVMVQHDPQIEEFMKHLQEKYSGSSNQEQLQLSSLQRYYELLCESESVLMQDDSHFDISHDASHKPMCTLKRSQRRKMSALEAMIKQLPSFKEVPKMNPQEMLNCSYLRLSQNAVEELEDQCRRDGVDPGIHAHMNQDQVEDYYASHESLHRLH